MAVTSNTEKGFRSNKVVFLNKFPCGSYGTIVEIMAEPELHGRLMGMGLFTGTRFRLLQGGRESKLPLLLAVGDTRIAFGPEIAKTVLVEK
jgi:Fe2+ transport system protein FeoA